MTDDAPPRPRAAERALQAMADAVGDESPGGRVAGAHAERAGVDVTGAGIPVAATVVLARDGAHGVEVLLIERPDRGSFAGAWVFPGGKLEASDEGPLGEATAPEEADARRAAVRETREETGLEVKAAELVTLSCWDPPPGLPLRIRTWFFVARAPEGALRLQASEAVAAVWIRPGDALRRHALGDLTLYPPTWVTLAGVAEAVDVEGLIDATRIAGVRTFESRVRRGPGGPVFYWREDAEYDPDGPEEASDARHRLDVGDLPWVYTRSGW